MFGADIPSREPEEEEEDNEDDNMELNRPSYEPIMLESRYEERQILGPPGDRGNCFGCVYVGEKSNTAIPYEPIMEIFDMQRKSLGKIKMAVLAKAMATKYAAVRREVNAAIDLEERQLADEEAPRVGGLKRRRAGKQRMPEWRARDILEHIRNHNQDPEVQQIIMLEEVQELREKALNACLERDAISGHIRCNKDQIACYEKLVKLQEFIQSKDPTKQALYSAGARVDPGAGKMSGKNLVSYWKKAKKNQ